MKKVLLFIFLSYQAKTQDILFLKIDTTDIYAVKSKTNNRLEEFLKSEENNKFMVLFSEKFSSDFDNSVNAGKILSTNIDELEMDLFDKKQNQLKFLKLYQEKISPELFKYVSNEIKYNYWQQIFSYPIIRGNADKTLKKVVSLPSVVSEGLSENQLNDPVLLEVNAFRSLLYFYITYQNSAKRKFEKYSDNLLATHDKSDYAIEHLKGEVLDYTLADLLNRHKALLNASLTKNILTQINDRQYKTFLEGSFLENIVQNDAKVLKEKEYAAAQSLSKDWEDMITKDGKPFDMSKYKGKVVYVDFWSSWCGPCRSEMPFSKQMHESLTKEQKEKIVFLYISIDEKEEAWRAAMENLGLDIFENAYASGGWAAKVVQKFKITGIPRYMIMDQTGKIIKAQANRPSNPETLKELLLLTN